MGRAAEMRLFPVRTILSLLMLMAASAFSAAPAHADERDPCHSASACAEAWLEALRLEYRRNPERDKFRDTKLYSRTLEDRLVAFGPLAADPLVELLDQAMRGGKIAITLETMGMQEEDFLKILERIQDHLHPDHADTLLRAADLAPHMTREHRYLNLVQRAGHPDWPLILQEHVSEATQSDATLLSFLFGVDPIERRFVEETLRHLSKATDLRDDGIKNRFEFLDETRLSAESMAALIAFAEDARNDIDARSLALGPVYSGPNRPVAFEGRLLALANRLEASLAALPPIPEEVEYDDALYDQWADEIERRNALEGLAEQARFAAEEGRGPLALSNKLEQIRSALETMGDDKKAYRELVWETHRFAYHGHVYWGPARRFALEIRESYPLISHILLASYGKASDAPLFRDQLDNRFSPSDQAGVLLTLGGLNDTASMEAIARLSEDHWNMEVRETAKAALMLLRFGGTRHGEIGRIRRKALERAADESLSSLFGPHHDAPVCQKGVFWYRGSAVELNPLEWVEPENPPLIKVITDGSDILDERPDVVVRVEGGWLIAADWGEFGGGLFFLDEQGRATRIRGGSSFVFAEPDRGAAEEAYFFTGMYWHMNLDQGWVDRVRRVRPGAGASAWISDDYGEFRGAPIGYRQLADGTVLIQTNHHTNFVMTRTGMHRGQCEQVLTER